MKMDPRKAIELAHQVVADEEKSLAKIDAAFERKARDSCLPVLCCAFASLAVALNDDKPVA